MYCAILMRETSINEQLTLTERIRQYHEKDNGSQHDALLMKRKNTRVKNVIGVTICPKGREEICKEDAKQCNLPL